MRFIGLCVMFGFAVGCANEPGNDSLDDTADVGLTSIELGEQLFGDTCAGCHGRNARGGQGGPDLMRELHHTDDELIFWMMYGKGENMPAFGGELDDDEGQAIVDWLRSED